ncbi:MAG: DUF3147 family protein [Verrucomicrobia bacterium]|nr:DUF3147 family protein [Verrucomicrobiota bacterium]
MAALYGAGWGPASRPLPMNQFPWDKLLNFTWMDGAKLFLSALVIVLVTKVQVFNDRLSALLIALPLTSLLAMLWMRAEKQSSERIANHAEGTFWFVLPTLPMFLVLPWMLRQGWGFGISLTLNCLMTIGLFFALVAILKPFGIKLL